MTGILLPVHFVAMLVGLTLKGLAPSLAYNIDTSPAAFFSNISKNFGYEVLQLGKGSKASIIVGAPGEGGELKSTGKVYQCKMQSRECEDIHLDENSGMPHLGMVLESNTDGSQMIACGSGHEQLCDKNLYMSGKCFLFDDKMNELKNITTGYQKCLKGNVDLVFLFDGSESLKDHEFNSIKNFMIDVMKKLRNSSIHFAAVQFSYDVKLEFDFNDYIKNPDPDMLLAQVVHEKSITNTFKAVEYVVNNVFIPERGMRKGANKVIIIITDGEASDGNNGNVEAAKAKGILRLIIGIGHRFKTEESQKTLRILASEPTNQYLKVLASFEELRDSFSDLQSKIYTLEGGGDGDRSDSSIFHLEMSSSGFSADISQMGLNPQGRTVLGAVGADNWAGGLLEQQKDFTSERFITTPLFRKEMAGAYLGYALKLLQRQSREFYAVGAPRYQHVGRVLVFEVNASTTNWTLKQEFEGQQTGSYFGAVLCVVDVDNNQETDLLLVGAQMQFTETEGGCVYVYGWVQDNLILQGKLHGVSGYPLGRFGAAITDLADINGDGWTDVAVGAPLEEEEKGAIYIYNGYKKGLQMSYSQRIKGEDISPSLKFFGRSIHGKTDLDEDGLIDITVGASGEVMVVRSRPIVTVAAQVSFQPVQIRVADVECFGDAQVWQNKVLNLNICFNTSLDTKSYKGPLSASLLFHLEIDGNRVKNRGIFSNGKKVTDGVHSITLGQLCIPEIINITNCIEDYLSPIKVMVDYSFVDDNEPTKGHPKPVLNSLKNRTVAEIPFQKNCGSDDICEADMKISFHDSGSKTLVIFPQRYLEVNLEVENQQEDAYFVTLHVLHIPGLSFRKSSVIRPNSPQIIVRCDSMLQGQDVKGLSCNISHPVYRNNTKTLIQLCFDGNTESQWGDNLDLEAYVSSNNEKNDTLHDNKANITIPVQYPIHIIVNRLDTSTQDVNFSSLNPNNETVTHLYKVENKVIKTSPLPEVMAFVKVPTTFPGSLMWNVDNIQTDPSVVCQALPLGNSIRSHSKLVEQCVADQYRIFKCDLGPINSSTINITGLMYFKDKPEHFPQSKFCTALWLTFNTRRFTNVYGHEFALFQDTRVEMNFVMNNLPIIIGSVVGGLFLLFLIIGVLYKVGFFKRNYKEKMNFQEELMRMSEPEDKQGADTEKQVNSENVEGDIPNAKCSTDSLDGETEPK
ncbi:integrin alpha-L [Varanus komodoensis]|uniref:integrin alpha-L n=1 Tax=Varanus komodoensis TaxID=61221 RepID=UPI001CF7D9E7|nr:integrin alpha-L [Varanus komodoensis]